MSRSKRSHAARAPNGVVPGCKAGKGTRARKFNIMRCYHHGSPDAEERAIERHERQLAKKAIIELQNDYVKVAAQSRAGGSCDGLQG